MLSLEQKRKLFELAQSDPVIRHNIFSDRVLWQKQIDILHAVRNYPRVAVKSGNTVGKSAVTADVAWDWIQLHNPGRVITTAPTFSQVQGILWKEIRSYYHKSKYPIGGEINQTEFKFNDDWLMEGISTTDVARFQGRHNPNLLVILDEASGVAKDIWDTVDALHPKRVLVIGNPLEATGNFAEVFESSRWHKLTISCQECVEWQKKYGRIEGLVTDEWVKDMADLHGIGSPWFRTHVLGEFPEQDEYALIERQWVDRARKGLDSDGLALDDEKESTAYRMVASDLATKHGSNETVIGYRYGHTMKDIRAYQKCTMTHIRDEIVGSYNAIEAHITGHDADGLGESMAELLSEMHVPCIEYHGGNSQKAMENKFKNLRSQFFWIVAKKFEKGLYNLKHLPDKEFEILRSQLCSIRVKAPDPMGRFQIETKEDMASRQIKSPDYADMFIVSEFLYFMRKMSELRPMRMGAF